MLLFKTHTNLWCEITNKQTNKKVNLFYLLDALILEMLGRRCRSAFCPLRQLTDDYEDTTTNGHKRNDILTWEGARVYVVVSSWQRAMDLAMQPSINWLMWNISPPTGEITSTATAVRTYGMLISRYHVKVLNASITPKTILTWIVCSVKRI